MTNNEDVIAAHRHCRCHREELTTSLLCGCFHCMSTFRPQKIEEWIDEEGTALCPVCMVDSVIGSASGYPISEDFLRRMHAHWFETTYTLEEVEKLFNERSGSESDSP